MRHRVTIARLPDYAAGTADAETKSDVRAHIDTCAECRGWVETYELLAEQLGSEIEDGSIAHPESDLLALCVIRPEELHESDRKELQQHLDSCTRCREEMRMVREALLAARPVRDPLGSSAHAPSRRRPSPRMWARAAAIVGFLLGAAVLLGLLLSEGPQHGISTARTDDGAGRAGMEPSASLEVPRTLTGMDLEGNRVIAADNLVISNLTVKSGADVTFRSKKAVAFGSGFRVASGAKIRVHTTDPEKHDPSSTPRGPDRIETDDSSGLPVPRSTKKGNQT